MAEKDKKFTNFVNSQDDTYKLMYKAKVNFSKSPKDRITLAYVEARIEALEKYWDSFYDMHRKILIESNREDLERSTYYANDQFSVAEEMYLEYKAKLKEALSQFKKPKSNSNNNGQVQQNVKLPTISLPTFTGKYIDWISFRDLFKSLIHNNENLDDVQKLHYLKAHVSGEAERLLQHIQITSDNYMICWKKLEDRYNNKKYLANSILKRLTNQKVISDSANSVKELLDSTNECLFALQNLGIDVQSWDIIIIHLVSQKLDAESRNQWETKINDASKSMELPTYSQFSEFLESRFRALESIESKGNKPNSSSKVTSNPKSHHVAAPTEQCPFCSETHKLCNCKGFSKQDVDERRKYVQINKLCFNCLKPNHSTYTCKQSTRCRLCKKKHHSLLHPKGPAKSPDEQVENNREKNDKEEKKDEPDSGKGDGEKVFFSTLHSQVLLATALVNVESRSGTALVLRSLLDQGSQASFVTESAVQLLGLKKVLNKSVISGLGGDQGASVSCKFTVKLKIQSRQDPSFCMTINAYVMKRLTTLLPDKRVPVKLVPSLPAIKLADPSFDTPNKIDLLLGAEVYSQILVEGLVKGPPGSPVAQNTTLGWILSGPVKDVSGKLSCHHHHIVPIDPEEDANQLLKSFWELESVCEINKHLTEEEQKCEEFFSATTKRDDSGRYIVKLPFRTEDPACKHGGSQNIALKRFLMLEKRFVKNPNLMVQYSQVIKEYSALGHMEEVQDTSKSDAVYLPHHAVVREDKSTTKVRVVFDASCPGKNGVSLNNDLMVGPTLQPELRHLIMKWRCHPICLVADIVKMYRQVKVSDEDTDFQRLLWRENPGDVLQHFRLLRVTFGTSSAPYLAVRALQQVARDDGDKYPMAAPRVLTDFYMDDLMTGCQSIEEGTQIYHEMIELLAGAGFQLQKWSSNSTDLLEQLKETNPSAENLELKIDASIKVLGLTWNRQMDVFQYSVQLPALEPPITKRKVISDIAKLFDPLGWIAPVVTTAKVFIQRLWLSGIEWDQELPEELLGDWLKYRESVKELTSFLMPRWIHCSNTDKSFELHGFSDASNVAYAAVIYARIVDENDNVHVSLVTAKTKVDPIKQVSIPRLELCGAVMAAKLLLDVSENLSVPKSALHAWTDSSVVLAWLSSHPSRWKTFVANRTAEILTIMDAQQWSHVRSKENPADCASRGISPAELLQSHLWQKGPSWLKEKEVTYRRVEAAATDLEERKTVKCHATKNETTEEEIIPVFSTYTRMLRVVALCKRVSSPQPLAGRLTKEELSAALLACIKLSQAFGFGEEIKSLEETGKVNKKSGLTTLNPFLDADGVLRVGGRLRNAPVEHDTKHPIIIPHNSNLAKLLVAEAHDRTLHGGPQQMLNYLRSKYWVIKAKNLVRQFARKCIACIRYSAKSTHQLMGQLPEARVTAGRPFLKSGVDYAGPIAVRPTKGRGYHSTKGYICVFVCMATRAIHLEIATSTALFHKGPLQDVIKILKETDPDHVPTFVARELAKLPPVTFDHVDVTSLLKNIVALKASQAELRAKEE